MFWRKKIVAISPPERVLLRFSPNENFSSDITRSTYIAGQVYFLREGNVVLERLLQDWVSQNKVQILED